MTALLGHQRAVWRALGDSVTGHLVRGAWTLCGRAAGPDAVPAASEALTCRTCAVIGPDRYTIGELAGLGLTVRQIHYWCERGWLVAGWAGPRRVFIYPEYAVARRAVALIRAGYRTESALPLARSSQTPSSVAVPEVP